MTKKELKAAIVAGEIDLTDVDNGIYKAHVEMHIAYLEQKQFFAEQHQVQAIGEEIDEWKSLLPTKESREIKRKKTYSRKFSIYPK